jgi:hypothetical protein
MAFRCLRYSKIADAGRYGKRCGGATPVDRTR